MTLCIATEGYIPGRTPLSIAVMGYLGCGAAAIPEAEETYSGGYFDYEALRLPRRQFKAKTREEKKAKPVLDDIAEEMKHPGIETQSDLEIVLRMRLSLQEIRYQEQYMTWLKQALAEKQALIKRKRRNKAITLLLLQ